ncbi:methanol/ethanol family PQQ-dependent dehydrogenase [Longimicrobium sp.]|uniref:methanol/ethanol family PQQ-dependent dehydrogenase n=1 Tax=Longimicrobium sp. TaxID=2029185 RepID=UPI002E323B80|nr:methanol/ethanol family PQQ-dependent dehydrogenase [Longimicrobium sp.]HEX6042804.1 methanol/ethanol family PQQ-dependent dehydrogenase [Longimicrobium sp.]
MRSIRVATALAVRLALLCLAAGCARGERPETDAGSALAARRAVAPGDSLAEDGQWLIPAKDYQSTRFSGLRQITTANVARLRPAWTFSTGIRRGHEAAPLVVGSTMYVVGPYPNPLFALDLARDGELKWTYTPPQQHAAQGVACCDVVNRGASYADGKIFFNTLDNQTVAVDARTGAEVWRTRLGDINRGETMTMAPLVVKDKVLVGNSGGEMGVRGWLTALNVSDGKIAWRAYSTGPDKDVLIGPDFKPFYAQDRGTDLGTRTWPSTTWRVGGGTVWGWISYDPELDLVYYGTGNPGPWNPEQRPGDNKWTAGIFARDPDDGQARWFYQWSPHDVHDYDGINENVLLDLPIGGRTRRTIVRAERNGYMYVLDRATGQVLSADPFVHITSSTGVDVRTGVYHPAPEKYPHMGQVTRDICPAAPGAKDWQPTAFSPRTGLLYVPHNNLCMDVESVEANYIAGTPYVGMNVVMHAGPGGHRGEFTAWDPVRRRPAWKIRERFPVWSGALATAGDVVFYGTMEGWFKALDARTGQLLWQFKTESGIIGQPISYRGPDGKQYVAVLSGVGGWPGAVVAGDLNANDSTGALGFAGAMRDLPQATGRGGTLYVFALP